jgi:hypothetical protein
MTALFDPFASVTNLREFTQMADELEAAGFLETVGIDPVTGEKRRRITVKGRQYLEIRDALPGTGDDR